MESLGPFLGYRNRRCGNVGDRSSDSRHGNRVGTLLSAALSVFAPRMALDVETAQRTDSAAEEEFVRGNALCDSRQFEAAIPHYDRAIELGQNDEVVWNNRGVALDSLGRHEESLESYRKALQANAAYE